MNRAMIRLVFFSSLLLVFTAGKSPAQEADAKLESVFKTYLDDYFKLRPFEATRLGDHRFDSLLEDLTPASRAKWLELTRKTLSDLPKEIDHKKLSRAGQIDLETFQHTLKANEWLAENTKPCQRKQMLRIASRAWPSCLR